MSETKAIPDQRFSYLIEKTTSILHNAHERNHGEISIVDLLFWLALLELSLLVA